MSYPTALRLDDAMDNTTDAIVRAGKLLKRQLEDAQPTLYSDLKPWHCMSIIENNEQWQKLALQEEYQTIFRSVYEQLSAGTSISTLLNPSSVTLSIREPTRVRIEDVVEDFLKSLEEPMKGYIQENRLPEWTLPETALVGLNESERADIVAYVHSLAIPARSDNPQRPDMLLHNLGKLADSEVADSIKRIFEIQEPCLLLSTSGSGKTRTVLEGLTQHWGFYFMCSCDDSGLGSRDLSSMINDGLPRDDRFTSDLLSVEDNGRELISRLSLG
ncbi:MAG: hypothetical protein NXY57DRAFT_1065597 [Lentinula lateritia]|nr:MAG: hypothetical protein NXY57DRAFT_1065597 [Lentinula lateritia]